MVVRFVLYMPVWGAGGLMQESRFRIKRQWDGQGSPPGAVEKSGTPYQQHCSDSD